MSAKARILIAGFGVLSGVVISEGVMAHSVRQSGATYRDNTGIQQSRIASDIGIDGPKSGALTSSSYNISAQRDMTRIEDIESTEEDRINHSVALTATHTFDRTADFRLLGSFADDSNTQNKTIGVGLSQWVAHDTFRLSADVSQSVTNQDSVKILDYDSTLLETSGQGTSIGVSIALRHLATTTTITDYSIGHISQDGRPDTYSGTFGIRQFIPAIAAAVHFTASYIKNKGRIGTQTVYGQVDAWQGELAWLQHLWQGARSRLAYRYYQETETTRAYEDEKVLGSDAVGLSLTQELPKGEVASQPVTLEIGGNRYVSNTNVSAASFQFGVATRF